MPALVSSPLIFPTFSPDALLAFQFSSWYPTFSHVSIKSKVIRPLSEDFIRYLKSDGVMVPVGSEDEVNGRNEEDDEEDEGKRQGM